MQVLTGSASLDTDRARSARLAIGALGACAVVALVDPGEPGRYPPCPTAALLGWDCPVCGTLRGAHALARGRVGDALDHNVLLVLAVPLVAVVWWGWVRHAVGRPIRPFRWSPAATMMSLVAVAAFALLRNLPIAGLSWLGSSA
jgi:hypothetical protein